MLVFVQLASSHLKFRIKGLGMCLIVITHTRRFKGLDYIASGMAPVVILPFINCVWSKGYGFIRFRQTYLLIITRFPHRYPSRRFEHCENITTGLRVSSGGK